MRFLSSSRRCKSMNSAPPSEKDYTPSVKPSSRSKPSTTRHLRVGITMGFSSRIRSILAHTSSRLTCCFGGRSDDGKSDYLEKCKHSLPSKLELEQRVPAAPTPAASPIKTLNNVQSTSFTPTLQKPKIVVQTPYWAVRQRLPKTTVFYTKSQVSKFQSSQANVSPCRLNPSALAQTVPKNLTCGKIVVHSTPHFSSFSQLDVERSGKYEKNSSRSATINSLSRAMSLRVARSNVKQVLFSCRPPNAVYSNCPVAAASSQNSVRKLLSYSKTVEKDEQDSHDEEYRDSVCSLDEGCSSSSLSSYKILSPSRRTSGYSSAGSDFEGKLDNNNKYSNNNNNNNNCYYNAYRKSTTLLSVKQQPTFEERDGYKLVSSSSAKAASDLDGHGYVNDNF